MQLRHPTAERSPRPALAVLAAVVSGVALCTTVASAGQLSPRASAVKECKQDCRAEYNSQFGKLCSTIPCIADRQTCLDDVAEDERVTSCRDACAEGRRPGRCTLLSACLGRCRALKARLSTACRQPSCPDGKDCQAYVAGLRDACFADCKTAAAITSLPRAARTPRAGGGCQQRCVEEIVGGCYDECDDNCEGDTEAENICRRACRDAECVHMKVRCSNDESFSNPLPCCDQPTASCPIERFQDDGPLACNVVTTTTSTSSVTSTSAASTTTTTATTLP